jgi:tRNA-binding EMAP/Myf-like protein
MITKKAYQIFGPSISKLNNIISRLDNQLGVISSKDFCTTKIDEIKIQEVKEIPVKQEIKEKPVKQEIKEKPVKQAKPEKQENKKENKPKEANLFDDVDLRVGKVLNISNMENSEDIYLVKIDLGENEPRDIGTGLRRYVPLDEFVGKNILVFANLKPKKLGASNIY